MKLYSWLMLSLALVLLSCDNAFAYLDPGSGSYVIQVLMAALFSSLFFLKNFWKKVVNAFSSFFRGRTAREQ